MFAISSFGKSSMSGRACRVASREERETPSVPPLILMHSAAFPAFCTRVDDGVQQYRSRVSVSDTLYARVSLLRTTEQTAAGTERNFVRSMEGAEYSRRPINKIERRKERNNEHFSSLAARREKKLFFLESSFPRERRSHCRTISSHLTKPRRQCAFLRLLPPLDPTLTPEFAALVSPLPL